MNRIYRIIKKMFISILVLLVVMVLLSQVKMVQNGVAQKGVKWFAQKTGTKVVIEDFSWRKIRQLKVDGFLMMDLQGDTLVALDELFLLFSPKVIEFTK